ERLSAHTANQVGERGRRDRTESAGYVFSVAAGILPAVEPGILPGGMGVWIEKSLPFRTSGPGGKMLPSTAAKMAAATDVNPTLNTYRWERAGVRVNLPQNPKLSCFCTGS